MDRKIELTKEYNSQRIELMKEENLQKSRTYRTIIIIMYRAVGLRRVEVTKNRTYIRRELVEKR